MGKFIDGLYYRNDQVEPDGKGGWRVRATPFEAIIEIVAEDTGADVPEPEPELEPEASPVDIPADEPVVVVSATPVHETKIITAKPRPGRDKDGGYDTK